MNPTRGAVDPADRGFMEQALALGALAEGSTSPNPRVGCVLVRDGVVVGRGFHREPGGPHAEALALAEAGDAARGATLYVNLEPCSHEGRTPPCADMLKARGVARVVASIRDPNPLVDGKGFARLRQAGIRVELGLLAEEATRLNDAFLHWHATARPLVTLKAAISTDGLISAAAGESRWITGSPARTFAHRLRFRHDAVLVGAGTLRRDDPRLTVRLPGVGGRTVRVVLTGGGDVDPGARLFETGAEGIATRVYTPQERVEEVERLLADRAFVIGVAANAGRVDLNEVLADLGAAEVQSLLVEGGARVHASFLEAGLADRAALFVSTKILGARGATPLVDGASVLTPAAGWRLEALQQLALGDDLLLAGRFLPGVPPESRR